MRIPDNSLQKCMRFILVDHGLGAGAAAAPAYAADTAAGRRVWRLLMPQGGPPAACPPGTGEGEFQPLGKPCTVVGALHITT